MLNYVCYSSAQKPPMVPHDIRSKSQCTYHVLQNALGSGPHHLSTTALIHYTPLAAFTLDNSPHWCSSHTPDKPRLSLCTWQSLSPRYHMAHSITSLRFFYLNAIVSANHSLDILPKSATPHSHFSFFLSLLFSSVFSTNICPILFVHLLPDGV